jgi:hypothetical protein
MHVNAFSLSCRRELGFMALAQLERYAGINHTIMLDIMIMTRLELGTRCVS